MKDTWFILLLLIYPFVRIAGKINWRLGRSFKCRKEKWYHIRGKIKPGMIILTHKKYELTNYFIPGYWTHTAMIVSEEEIVEAVRQGVMKKRFEDFFSTVDDFLILEPRFCDTAVMEKATRFAENVIGYSYNFFFIPREKSLFCTELIFNAYAYASGKDLQRPDQRKQEWDFAGGASILPQKLADLCQYWKIVERNGGPSSR